MTAIQPERQSQRRKSPCRRALLSRFLKNNDGATVVEFAMIATPFFLMLMGILEITMSYFASIQLENGLETVARRIRTGEVQAAKLTAAQFKDMLCAETAPLLPCNANLYVDVRQFADFSKVDYLNPVTNGKVNTDFQFDPGVSGSIVLARAFYVWHINTPMIGTFLANLTGSDRLLVASQVFRNEPWTPN